MVRESDIQREIHLAATDAHTRLFRNNVALAWAGQFVGVRGDLTILRNARRLHAGLCVGSGDLIGWRTIDGIAQFVSIEVKTNTGRPSPEQRTWHRTVTEHGGISIIARSINDIPWRTTP